MANADTPQRRRRARASYGAMGIGLCRTERMFNAADRLPIVQEMILAETPEERRAALDRLLPIQRADFKGIFKAMAGLPVTVRLLDPPMHEFLPTARAARIRDRATCTTCSDAASALEELPDTLKLLDPELTARIRRQPDQAAGEPRAAIADRTCDDDVDRAKEAMLKKVRALAEVNPMLGHRGVRLGITYPEIYDDADPAILEAAADVRAGRHRGASRDHGAAGLPRPRN